MSKYKNTLGTSLCAALLTAVTFLPQTPVAAADPAEETAETTHSTAADTTPAGQPAEDKKSEEGKENKAEPKKSTKKDKAKKPKKVSEFDATQADVDRLLKAPVPKDVDGLISRAEKISRTAAAASDLVEKTKGNIAKERKAADKAKGALKKANDELRDSQANVDRTQASLSEVSRSTYRGANVDPVSAIAGASGPAAAMDRSAYLTALTRDAQTRMDAVSEEQKKAHAARSKAARTQAQANHRINELRYEERKLDDHQETLDRLKAEVKEIVDGFSPEERRQWVDRNGPIDIDVDEFLGSLKKAKASGDYAGAVAAAMGKLGSPYGWGATGPDAFDCSGLMFWAYQQVGKSIPRTSQAQLAGGQSVSTSDLQPGDIVAYYPGATHVGMYIGDGNIVHASDYGIPVQVVPVDSMPIVGASRY